MKASCELLVPLTAMGPLRATHGLVLCVAWCFTIISGFYMLYCPVLYLIFVNHKWYRIICDQLFVLWELYAVALFQWCYKTQVHHYGDFVDADEAAIIVMNHRTRVDWNFVWIALYHATQIPNNNIINVEEENNNKTKQYSLENKVKCFGGTAKIKLVLKDEIKCVPALGWVMQLNYFLYVKRDWREDQHNLAEFIDYYRILQYDCRIVLFPEGTDLSDETRRRSDRFAALRNLPSYNYVLHPRTTGWTALCSRLKENGLKAVYDVTLAYDRPPQTEADMLQGRIPTHAHFYFKRYPIEELPNEEDSLKIWLNDRWKEKERVLKIFHAEGMFVDLSTNHPLQKRLARSLNKAKLSFVFWTFINIIFIYEIINSHCFLFWVTYHSLLFVFVTWYFGGFHKIQYTFLKKKIRPIPKLRY